MKYYARKTQNGETAWQPLSEHLQKAAEKAAEFAEPLGFPKAAQLAGLLHDLGKYRRPFQEYLSGEREGSMETHHAVYGAALAFQKGWTGPAFAAAGHHAGLHNLNGLQDMVGKKEYDAASRLAELTPLFEKELGALPDGAIAFEKELGGDRFALEFYMRMLFSCLVDADFLDTERFMTGEERSPTRLDPETLLERLQKHRAELSSKSDAGELNSELNQLRNRVYEDCVEKAQEPQGFFSLTVPTGGGKTLSGMAFALAHAQKHKLRRVIVVIPYLSIIEQNAEVYRRVLDPDGENIVIEHHSAAAAKESRGEETRAPEERAAENWDAPIVVTTSVQFIESLFANRPSKCRKLHNIAQSVVLMDEAQTLPTHLLNPFLNVLRELKERYGTTIVFSTATQPAFRRGPSLPEGLDENETTEIVSNPPELFQKLRRAEYTVRPEESGWEQLAQEWTREPQALGVVNMRKQAVEWYQQLRRALKESGMGDEIESVYHISSAMCAEHRSKTLKAIRKRLKEERRCWVVSTQVVEAGVDIDFPLVYRALGPLDSIVQAGGRCNREGRLSEGRVEVFRPADHRLPGGVYRTASQTTAQFLERHSFEDLLSDPSLFSEYFSQLYQYISTDHQRGRETSIQEDRRNFRFREVAKKAKVIPDDTRPVIAPMQEAMDIVRGIRERGRLLRGGLRQLQRYMVNLNERDINKLESGGLLQPLLDGSELRVLAERAYNSALGVCVGEKPTEEIA